MLPRMRYRLGMDLGTTSIGWCLIRLDANDAPCAVIKMGSRIFSDGRSPKDGSSLAVTRRLARQMRRRRDRHLKRKARLQSSLIRLGFWPAAEHERKALALLDPYTLRRDGLDKSLPPAHFGRALFHLNQRRGFLSNRKTDKRDNDSGLLKSAIRKLRDELTAQGLRTVGEWLAMRHAARQSVRARLRGKSVKDKAYDLYIDRAMVAEEFDRLWASQAAFDPVFYSDSKRNELRDILLHQRALRPVRPGRCTLIPDQERAAMALPSTQRFRIFQELNNLRPVSSALGELPLTLAQRDTLVAMLEQGDVTFTKMRHALGLSGTIKFNLEDKKRDRLKGNSTTKILGGEHCFGKAWNAFDAPLQDEIVDQLLNEASLSVLVDWLIRNTGVEEHTAEYIANTGLMPGFGNLSRAALARVLPELRLAVITYDDAVRRAGFESHSALSHAEQTGEVMAELPYYGEALQRHVGFADPRATETDLPEKRFGRIANPTVHIGLNEVRKVVNALIRRYGHPSEIIVEVARELKQGLKQRQEEQERQAERQKQNHDFRAKIQSLPGREGVHVSAQDIQRIRLWTELNHEDAANRRCPYTGEQISVAMLFSGEVEIEHILPFSMTLDDSLNNKTVVLRRANRDKGNQNPFDAFGHSPAGYDYEAILQRATLMPRDKAKRFAADGYQRWLREDDGFLARALTDTAYLSRITKEYLSLICPANKVRVIPGRLTAMLRGKFGLNQLLSQDGAKNRDDHRHHAIDAAVIGVTDQGLLQRFAKASADARAQQLDRLVASMPMPWLTYREHVARAVARVVVSHRPDHGHEGALHNATAYGLRADGKVVHRVMLDTFKASADIEKLTFADEALKTWLVERTAGLSGKEFAVRLESLQRDEGVRRVRVIEQWSVIGVRSSTAIDRHGVDDAGEALAYKGYRGDSNYCIEIFRNDKGRWEGDVISTFEAHAMVRLGGIERLTNQKLARSGLPLVMRLCRNDACKLEIDGQVGIYRIANMNGEGRIALVPHVEANADARTRLKELAYVFKSAGSLQKAKARQVHVSPTGMVSDPGFTG